MKIKKGFELRNVCGEHVVLAVGRENIDFNSIISMNSTSAFLWQQMLGKDFTATDMAEALLGEYEVDRDTALADSQHELEEWIKAGLVE